MIVYLFQKTKQQLKPGHLPLSHRTWWKKTCIYIYIYLYMYIFLEIHKWLPITDTSNLEQWWWPSLPQQALRKGHAGPPMDFSKTLVRHNHRHETWEGAVGYPWLHGNKGDLVPMCLLPTWYGENGSTVHHDVIDVISNKKQYHRHAACCQQSALARSQGQCPRHGVW